MLPDRAPARIGYVLKMYPRLSETFIVDEILALETIGVDIEIFSLRPPSDGRFHSDLSRVRAPVTYVPGFGSRSTMATFETVGALGPHRLPAVLEFLSLLPEDRRHGVLVQAAAVANAVRDRQLDHLHAHFMTIAAHVAYIAHLLTDVPFTVTCHAKDIYRHGVDRTVFDRIAAAATTVVTVCEANRRHIEANLVQPGRRIDVVYNGVFLDRFSVADSSSSSKRILAVGRMVEKKGFDVLLDACAVLRDRNVEFECVLVGAGDQEEALHRRADRLGITEHIQWFGPASRDEVVGIMQGARVLAAPCVAGADGNQDALPTVIIEALAVGLPVVSTDVGGIVEIVTDGTEGIIVGQRDPNELADALERLLTDNGITERMSTTARAKAVDRFDRIENARRLAEAFGRQTIEVSAT